MYANDRVGNQCIKGGAKVEISVSSELVEAVCTDNGDGSHGATFSADYAGFYQVDVTLDTAPVGQSPYTACVFNDSIAFPPTLLFYKMKGALTADALPPRAASASPSTRPWSRSARTARRLKIANAAAAATARARRVRSTR